MKVEQQLKNKKEKGKEFKTSIDCPSPAYKKLND